MKNPFKTDLPEFLEWVDPEQERKDNKNAKIVGRGLGVAIVAAIFAWFLVSPEYGFVTFFGVLFGTFLFLED
jgi:hypothetical protein